MLVDENLHAICFGKFDYSCLDWHVDDFHRLHSLLRSTWIATNHRHFGLPGVHRLGHHYFVELSNNE